MNKLAIFLPNWLGDLVMATPALRAIRRRYPPPCRIVGIVRPQLAEALLGTELLDEQWCFDPTAAQPDYRRLALIRRMRREQLDVALLLTNSFHTALLAWLGGARERVGYARYGRGMFLTRKLYPLRMKGKIVPRPVAETYLALAAAMDCPPHSPRLEMATTPRDEAYADRVWGELGLRSDGRVVALHAGGAYGEAKRWPSDHCAQLARLIAQQLDHDVLVLCGPRERRTARNIALEARHQRVFSLASHALGLGLTKAVLRRCRLAVCTDSGPRHLAAAFGKPVVTLFGPTLPIWVENPTVHSVNLCRELDCLGCGRRACPLGHHRCMNELSPQQVFAAVASLLDTDERRRRIAG